MVGQQLSPRERAFVVLRYVETGHNITQVKADFRQRFHRAPPCKTTILNNVQKYNDTGTSENLNKGRSGRPRTARSAQNVAAVRRSLRQNPKQSCRRNNIPQLSKSSFNRITRFELKFHPYHMQRRHALNAGDYPRRLNFCRWLLGRPQRFLTELIIGDEATFKMNGHVNTHNVRYYADHDNVPRDFVYDIPNDQRKLTVWIGMIGNNTLLGPYFFPENVTAAAYLTLINELVPELHQRYGQGRNGAVQRVWWCQDGAPAHRANVVSNRLQQLFPNRVIGAGHAIEWPPRSPDLTPCDFCLWGYLKERVYLTPPRSIQELEQRIRNEVIALRRTRIVRRAVHQMEERAQRCVRLNGRQIEGRAGGE